MSAIHLALAEELEKLAAGYRALADSHKKSDKVSIQDISFVLLKKSIKVRQQKLKLY